MPEYIEREALLAELEDEIDFVSPFYNAEQNQYFTMGLRCAYRDAHRFPAADVTEVRHGEWVQIGYDEALDRITCSCCKEYFNLIDNCTEAFNYCPHCGAKMDGGTNDDSKKSVRASE